MKLEANKRTPGKANALRRQGLIPGIVYNKQVNLPVTVELRAFDKVFRSQGISHVIDLDVDGETHEVLVRQVQMDKRRRLPKHVDFYEVTAGQQVQVDVHLDFVGTPAGAREGGQIDIQRREVVIWVLPRLIPEKVEVDVSGLAIGDSLHVQDIVGLLPTEAEIMTDLELTLFTVVPPRVAEEETETEEVAAEPELIARGGADEDDEETEE